MFEDMMKKLPEEIALISGNQGFLAQTFHKQVIAEAEKVNTAIKNLREMIQENHNSGVDKSFLKAKIEEYEECMPCLKMNELHRLLNIDLETVNSTAGRGKDSLKIVSQNYERFMKEQMEVLSKFIVTQENFMYGPAAHM